MEVKANSFQLKDGILYMNTFDKMYGLGLGVWTHPYKNPVYILRSIDGEIGFVQFESKKFADEWLKENSKWWTVDQILEK